MKEKDFHSFIESQNPEHKAALWLEIERRDREENPPKATEPKGKTFKPALSFGVALLSLAFILVIGITGLGGNALSVFGTDLQAGYYTAGEYASIRSGRLCDLDGMLGLRLSAEGKGYSYHTESGKVIGYDEKLPYAELGKVVYVLAIDLSVGNYADVAEDSLTQRGYARRSFTVDGVECKSEITVTNERRGLRKSEKAVGYFDYDGFRYFVRIDGNDQEVIYRLITELLESR